MQAIKLKINTPPPQTQQPQIQSQIPNATSKAPVLKMKVQPPVTSSTSIATATLKTEAKPMSLKIKAPVEEYRVTAENYSKYANQRDHAYDVPDMYIGSVTMMGREERVLDLETWLFKTSDITLSHGAERLFIEIASNAGDNAARSMRKKVDPGEVVVTMTDTTIRVRNGGIPIPVEIHPVEKMYVPEMIFGTLMSGSNYGKDKVRTEAGKNGLGVKLANIFSKYLKITVADPHNEKLYTQVWENNMLVRHDPVIVPFSKTEKAFVEVEYMMDFARFGYTENKYPKEAFELYARHVLDMAFTLKIPVSFNGKKFVIKNAKDYAKLYLGKEAVKNSILYITWPEGTKVDVKKGVEFAVDKSVLPLMEICAVDTPDVEGKVAFVNGLWTRNNGVHYDAAFKAVATSVLETVNGGDKKGKKGGDKKEKKSKAQKLTLGDVKRHVSLFVNCWVENPVFDSQSKNELKAPIPKITIDEKILRPIMKWDLVNRLYAELDAKLFKNTTKSDGKKRRFLSGMDKLTDANKAGTNESVNCTLYVTEGDSALTYGYKLASFIPNNIGPDYIGLLPLRGKPLNVMNAPALQIAENKEINDLKKVLGLRESVDYTIQENYETLRYGHLLVLNDADLDGFHILGLIMNLFHCKYPSLLARGYLKYLRTKILEVKKGANVIKFYSQHEYEEWKMVNPDFRSWKHSYFKGLGSSETEDILAESKNPKIVMSIYDEYAPDSLRLAFDKEQSDRRKKWISSWVPDYTVETMQIQPISGFINHQFIQYSIADLARSIPRFTDGLKISQRKILWTALKRWGKKAGNSAEKMKVAQFAASVSENMAYMHGEKSLEGAIVGMAQDFVGSNNVPFFERNGELGTRRLMGGDASSGRYIFTRPEIYLPYIFRKEDNPILNILVDEGQEIEPLTLLPIVPMHLVNGVLGIGSGSSTFIPAHNLLDIVYWLESKIKNLPLPELIPWYRGFNGEIKLDYKKKRKEESDDEGNEDEQDKDEILIDKNTKITLVTTGCFEKKGGTKNSYTITELPIGRSIHSYKVFLDNLREQKIITKYENYSTTDIPKFTIHGIDEPNLKQLKLVKSFGMSNMVLLDDQNRPIKYDNAASIMETFYSIRLGYYAKRKEYILNEITSHIATLNAKIKFILAIIKGYELIKGNSKITDEEANSNGGILVLGRNKKDITAQLERCGVDQDLYKKITLHNCTEEEVQVSRDEIQKLEEERKTKEETKPEQFWLDDLSDLVKCYCKHYKCKYESPKKLTLKVL